MQKAADAAALAGAVYLPDDPAGAIAAAKSLAAQNGYPGGVGDDARQRQPAPGHDQHPRQELVHAGDRHRHRQPLQARDRASTSPRSRSTSC